MKKPREKQNKEAFHDAAKGRPLLFDIPGTDTSYYEKILFERGIRTVAGVDEVGRGCLAGPVLAAAVILPFPCKIEGITDSKRLSPARREELYDIIIGEAVSVGFGSVDPREIDEINILQATRKAMRLAIEALGVNPKYLLVDGSHVVPVKIPQLIIPKGDYRSISVAAASIVAKVSRDRMMAGFDEIYPPFRFSIHKGYGTEAHLAELRNAGPTPIHRRSFRGVCG